MSEAAKIILTGRSKNTLLKQIKQIREWDGGHNYDIRIAFDQFDYGYVYDSIDNVEAAIKGDLEAYIIEKADMKNKIIKSGGCDDLYVVDDPDLVHEREPQSQDHSYRYPRFKKVRNNSNSHMIPKKKKKKKKKKTKKTHRR